MICFWNFYVIGWHCLWMPIFITKTKKVLFKVLFIWICSLFSVCRLFREKIFTNTINYIEADAAFNEQMIKLIWLYFSKMRFEMNLLKLFVLQFIMLFLEDIGKNNEEFIQMVYYQKWFTVQWIMVWNVVTDWKGILCFKRDFR